jgi:hypothetical protein
MPRFEVFCPAAPPVLAEDFTLRVDAEHWLAAMKLGLQKLGGTPATSHLMADVQADGSIHVTDPRGGGVFRIRELRAEAPPRPAAATARAGGAGGGAPGTAIGRPRAPRASSEDVLAELFEEVSEVARLDRQAGLERLLDLALGRTGAEAGSVLLARLGGRELEFAAVRGPRARELTDLRPAVPVGVGIVGFCVQEDVCLAVSDAEKDARFHRAISEAVGYRTRSILCAPIGRGGQVLGALEVLNQRGPGPFDVQDLAVVAYLAHQCAEHLARHPAA